MPHERHRKTPMITRRRCLTLVAAASAAYFGRSDGALASQPLSPYRWRGTALGAAASLTIYHPDGAAARRLVEMAQAEIERLEAVFSLYRPESAIARLNRLGRLDAPPMDLVVLLARARHWADVTQGAFDPTVQPLWQLFARHFATTDAAPNGPDEAAIEAARRLVDYRALRVDPEFVAMDRPGMAITLNGIAQGYITDRVADLLRAEGLDHVLIDLGELRALGARPNGEAWRVGLQDPRRPDAVFDQLAISGQAVATSAAQGTVFDGQGRLHHLFDPKSGRPSEGLLSATVVAERATDADALSTALVADPGLLVKARESFAGLVQRILTVAKDGSIGDLRLG